MTRAEIRTRVDKWLEQHGQAAWLDNTTKDTWINERLVELSELTWCIYGESLLTLTAGTYEYDYHGSAVSKKVVFPLHVSKGGILRDYANVPGPVSFAEMEAAFLLTGTAGTVTRWGRKPPHSIRFDKIPDSAPGTATIYGALRHSLLDDDSDLVEIPEAYLDTAAQFIAVKAGLIRSTGQPLEKLQLIYQSTIEMLIHLTLQSYDQAGEHVPPILRGKPGATDDQS